MSRAPPVLAHEVALPAGAVLIACSYGLIERRGTDFDDQVAQLTAVFQACDPARAGTPTGSAVDILDALYPGPGSRG